MSNSILKLMYKNCCNSTDNKQIVLKKIRAYVDFNNYPYIDDLESKIGRLI